MAWIYKITNLINGKSYIGQTIQKLEFRWQGHICDLEGGRGSPKLQYAFNKYGKDNFAFQRIEECQTEELDKQEKYWIEYYDTYENGYNSTLGGQTGGKTHDYRLIADRYLELRSLRKTAEAIGCSIQTVQKAVRSFNIDAMVLGKRGGRQFNTKDYQLYYDEYMKGSRTVDIAKQFGTSPMRVSRAITEISGKTPKELDREHRSLLMCGQPRGPHKKSKN